MLHLIDTSVWISALRGTDSGAVRAVSALLDEDNAAVCPIMMQELFAGANSEKHYIELLTDMKALRYLAVTDGIWEKAFRLGFELRRKGLSAPATDVLIAVVALEHDCVLLHDDRHFDLIARRTKLRVKRA